jgi:hypothetical protein
VFPADGWQLVNFWQQIKEGNNGWVVYSSTQELGD